MAAISNRREVGGASGPKASSGRSEGARGHYRSPLRRERAEDTRRRITTAGLELFAERGYQATTVAAIAEAAGVAVQTVYATFGSKAGVLKALLTEMEHDAHAPSWAQRIDAAAEPADKLRAFAGWTTSILSVSRRAITAAQHAGGDPGIAELKAEGDRRRRAALERLLAALDTEGALRPGLDRRRATDQAWVLTSVEVYLAATNGCGWSDADYTRWLGDLLVDQLLAH
jgi:AcrR family transcriptional regulator